VRAGEENYARRDPENYSVATVEPSLAWRGLAVHEGQPSRLSRDG